MYSVSDFDAICGQEVPAPWEEENGLYAVAVSSLSKL